MALAPLGLVGAKLAAAETTEAEVVAVELVERWVLAAQVAGELVLVGAQRAEVATTAVVASAAEAWATAAEV